MFLRLLTLFAIILGTASAANISIKLDESDLSKMPASDLVYQGNKIDELEAFELKKSGVDLSNLNPVESKLWQKRKHSVENYRSLQYPKAVKVKFKNFKASPREFFRAQVIDKKSQRQFVITASLDNHTNILRASMLRLLGYDIDVPKFYKKMEIEFTDEIQKKKFIDLVGEETLTKRDKWILKDSGKKKLLIKGFTLEPAELKNVNIHLPVMVRSRQIDRRSFRSLIALYALTDFPQKVNAINWSIGRSFNNNFSLNHPYASEFKNITYDDFKWMLKKLSRLSRNEIKKSLELSQYPNDIEELILEKILSRLNSMNKYFDIQTEHKVNKLITLGNIVSGRLTGGDYKDYVVEFFEKDPENPYRFSEIFRLFKTQIIFSSLSGILDTAIQRFVPGLYTTDAAESVQNQIQEFRTNNPGNNGVLPINAFASPLASGRVFANRNVVFGQYLGSTAPIQLVDSVGAEANLGVYSGITGLSRTIMPNLTANVSYGRSFVHVRAMPDLKSASSQSVKNLFIPRLMKKLGRVIKDEYECAIPNKAFVEESILSDNKIFYIKYDKKLVDGKAQALKLRTELINAGTPAGEILLVVIDRDNLCIDEIAETRKKTLAKFVKQFAMNETFIINDTLRISGNINAPIPITALPGLTVSLGTEHNFARLKSVMLKKTDYGMEITIAHQKDLRNGIKEGLNYFIEILSHSNSYLRGNLISKVYKINLEDIDSEEQTRALRALREILVSNNHEQLKEHYKATNLDHDVWAKLRNFRLLWFRTDKVKMDHTVEIVIPNKADQDFPLEQRKRKLFSTFIIKRSGSDFQSFIDRALNSLVDFVSIGSSNGDPGQTFMGSGKKTAITTESELTENQELSPITRIEFSWTGWKKKTKKLEKIFKKIEAMYAPFTDNNLIDRSQFNSSPRLRSYDIKNTLILYPSAFEKIEQYINSTEGTRLNALYQMYGPKRWNNFCERAQHPLNNCRPVSVGKLLKMFRRIPLDRVGKSKAINKIYAHMIKKFDISSTLRWLGEENFFSSTRVTGFRENHHLGFIEYISDTVGNYNTEIGTGIFDKLGNFLGISPFELRAMSYTPGL